MNTGARDIPVKSTCVAHYIVLVHVLLSLGIKYDLPSLRSFVEVLPLGGREGGGEGGG